MDGESMNEGVWTVWVGAIDVWDIVDERVGNMEGATKRGDAMEDAGTVEIFSLFFGENGSTPSIFQIKNN